MQVARAAMQATPCKWLQWDKNWWGGKLIKIGNAGAMITVLCLMIMFKCTGLINWQTVKHSSLSYFVIHVILVLPRILSTCKYRYNYCTATKTTTGQIYQNYCQARGSLNDSPLVITINPMCIEATSWYRSAWWKPLWLQNVHNIHFHSRHQIQDLPVQWVVHMTLCTSSIPFGGPSLLGALH